MSLIDCFSCLSFFPSAQQDYGCLGTEKLVSGFPFILLLSSFTLSFFGVVISLRLRFSPLNQLLVGCPLGVNKKVVAFYFRYDLLLAQPPSFHSSSSSSFFFPSFLLLPPRMRPAGSRGQAQTPPRGGGRGAGQQQIGTPGGRSEFSRAPARTPQSPKSH